MAREKLTNKLIAFMSDAESRGVNPKDYSGVFILQRYYEYIGMEPDLPVGEWFSNITKRKYPAFASITRAIRKARELNPQWRKDEEQVAEEVKDFKENVGY